MPAITKTPTPWPGFCKTWEEPGESEAATRRALEDAKADEAALWALAELNTPPDIVEFGERHKMPELAKYLWQSAFVTGWRAHHRATHSTDTSGEKHD